MFRDSLNPHSNALYLHDFVKKSIDELRRTTSFDAGDKFSNSVFSQQIPLLRSLFVRYRIRTSSEQKKMLKIFKKNLHRLPLHNFMTL